MNAVTLGIWLEARRKEAELSLDELSARTKIHSRFLDALERGDESSLPTRVHARAFALAYAKACGAGEEEAARKVREAFPAPSAPQPTAVTPGGRKVATVEGRGPVAPAVGAIDSTRQRAPAPAPASLPDIDVAADLVLQPDEELWPWKQWAAIAALAVLGLWVLKLVMPSPAANAPAPGSQAGDIAPGVPNPVSPAAEAATEELSLRARRPCWVVLEIDGKRLPTVLLEPDKKETWRVSQKAVVLFGNVGAVRVWWRGQNLDYLGALGARKNGVVFEVGQGLKEDPEQGLALPPGVPESPPAQPE